MRGAVRERLNDDSGAVADYTEALKRDPKDARIYMARSAVYVRLKKYAESLEDRHQAVQLEPKNPEAYVARGGALPLTRPARKGLAGADTTRSASPRLRPSDGPHAATRISCSSAGTKRFRTWTRRSSWIRKTPKPGNCAPWRSI